MRFSISVPLVFLSVFSAVTSAFESAFSTLPQRSSGSTCCNQQPVLSPYHPDHDRLNRTARPHAPCPTKSSKSTHTHLSSEGPEQSTPGTTPPSAQPGHPSRHHHRRLHHPPRALSSKRPITSSTTGAPSERIAFNANVRMGRAGLQIMSMMSVVSVLMRDYKEVLPFFDQLVPVGVWTLLILLGLMTDADGIVGSGLIADMGSARALPLMRMGRYFRESL
ncbi:hypothetical protein V5O48_012986 [Marasmius crinis-equi]|uniref:Uncharacterized protein n=1 Tax=Marasmius crinis-equi TaxID=585013 RepID=A0ABR3F1B9_9AGAR